MDVSDGIFVHVLWLYIVVGFLLLVCILVLVQQRVLQVGYCYTVSFEEPGFEFLNHSRFKGGHVLVQLNDVISELLYLLHFELVVPFTNFLLLHHLEFLFVDNIL